MDDLGCLDAYVKGFFGTRYMKMMGNFSNKKLFAWVLEARDREVSRREERERFP